MDGVVRGAASKLMFSCVALLLATHAGAGVPDAERAEQGPSICFTGGPLTGLYATASLSGAGRVRYGDREYVLPDGGQLIIPELVEAFRPEPGTQPPSILVLEADGGAPFEAVGRVLASMVEAGFSSVAFPVDTDSGGGSRCVLLLTGMTGPSGEATPAPILLFHLAARHVYVVRGVGMEGVTGAKPDGLNVWREGGELDEATLRAILAADAAEARRADTVVILNVDANLPHADAMALLAWSREFGFEQTILAVGHPGPGPLPVPPPAPVVRTRLETPALVRVEASGDVTVVGRNGRAETLPLAEVASFEERCEAERCALVLRTVSGRRVAMGVRPAGESRVLLHRQVYAYDDAPSRIQPTRTGLLSALAPLPEPAPPP